MKSISHVESKALPASTDTLSNVCIKVKPSDALRLSIEKPIMISVFRRSAFRMVIGLTLVVVLCAWLPATGAMRRGLGDSNDPLVDEEESPYSDEKLLDAAWKTFDDGRSPSQGSTWVFRETPAYDEYYEHCDVDRLGKGSSGVVKKLQRKKDGMSVAMKRITKGDNLSDNDRQDIRKEVIIMMELNSAESNDHIIEIIEVFESEKEVCIVMEYCGGGDLGQRIDNEEEWKKTTLDEKQRIVEQMLTAIACVHKHGILYLDVKPENFVFSEDFEILKLIDFGLARRLTEGYHEYTKGTLGYIAPEILHDHQDKYSTPMADIWSIGVTVYEMFFGYSPFDNLKIKKQRIKITDREIIERTKRGILPKVRRGTGPFFPETKCPHYEEWCKLPPQLDFIARCLEKKPKKRMSTTKCLEHMKKNEWVDIENWYRDDRNKKEEGSCFTSLCKLLGWE